MIEVQELVKWYGPVLAVDHLTFEIPEGQIIGFLGPNGAGKSTTLRILTGYMPPTSGRATVAGLDVLLQSQDARSHIGYLPESNALYGEMRVEEYLHYRGKLQGMDRGRRVARINAVCDTCGLDHARRRLVGQLSKGNRQRVGLAQALLHEPPVLILDEPTSGLDPTQITHVRELIQQLRGRHTIILSTHILPEVERTADRVMIIARGKIVADGSPDELRNQLAGDSAALFVDVKASPEAVERVVAALPDVASVDVTARDGWSAVQIKPNDHADLREPVGQLMLSNGWQVREMRSQTASLEQLFIEITAQQDQAAVDAA